MDPEFLTSGYVYCTCRWSIDISRVARNGKFGTCPTCSRLFDWPVRKAESKTQLRRRREAERSREPMLF